MEDLDVPTCGVRNKAGEFVDCDGPTCQQTSFPCVESPDFIVNHDESLFNGEVKCSLGEDVCLANEAPYFAKNGDKICPVTCKQCFLPPDLQSPPCVAEAQVIRHCTLSCQRILIFLGRRGSATEICFRYGLAHKLQ